MSTSVKNPLASSEIYIWLTIGFLFSMIGTLGKESLLFFFLLPQVAVVLTQMGFLMIENKKFLSIKLAYAFAIINFAYFSSYGFFVIFN